MRYKIEYCDKQGNEALLQITTFGDSSTVVYLEGTEDVFKLRYKMDTGDRSGYFFTSSAEINIYETNQFNIDLLKTSNEQDILVEFFVNASLKWFGYVIPDFFHSTIGDPVIVSMVATDRLGTLKNYNTVLPEGMFKLKNLLINCLSSIGGYGAPINWEVGIESDGVNIMEKEIDIQRIKNHLGRNINNYEIIRSICVLTNSIICQRNGGWMLINKMDRELLPKDVFTFGEVSSGAERYLVPVASEVGIFHEHGGQKIYPENYNFSDYDTGWIPSGGYVYEFKTNNVVAYTAPGVPIYGAAYDNFYQRSMLVGNLFTDFNSPKISSVPIPVVSYDPERVEVEFNINVTGQNVLVSGQKNQLVFRIVASGSGLQTLYLSKQGDFRTTGVQNRIIINNPDLPSTAAITVNHTVRGVLSATDVSLYNISIEIFGSPNMIRGIFVNYATIRFKDERNPVIEGNVYKVKQGSNFTKKMDIETTLFGDYAVNGINGYFYSYPINDTSSIDYAAQNWTTIHNSNQLPILLHSARQMSQMFSAAHNMLRAEIDVNYFDALMVFRQVCAPAVPVKNYIPVDIEFNFLKSAVSGQFEEVLYDNTLLKKDYIYSITENSTDEVNDISGVPSNNNFIPG